jgi:hypothetical protein
LGLKKIKLFADDNEKRVLEKLTSDAKDEDGLPLGFPQLKQCGGFEILQWTSNFRDLCLIKVSWSVKELKTVFTSQSKIYLRPIQKSIPTKHLDRQAML